MIFEKVWVLEVLFALAALMFALGDSSLLKDDYLLPEWHEIVLAEGTLVAHAHMVL